ncbi:hypothetical protein HDE_02904 [Halotydeus destructor]|nr:hypothetical protein HDE_02904 [Halotydeus destructor]
MRKMPSLQVLNIFPRVRTYALFDKIKLLLVILIASNVIYQITVSFFAMDFLIATTQKQLPNPTAAEDIKVLLILFLVISLIFDVVGIIGVLYEHFNMVIFYAVIVTLGGIFAMASVFNGQPIVILDVIIYIAVGSLSFYYANLIRNGGQSFRNMQTLP